MPRDLETGALPLFPDLPSFPQYFVRECTELFDDPFLAEIAFSAPVQRLKNIGFLGALDHIRISNGYQSHRRRHSRYEHSVGVADLALLYADIKGLNRRDTRVLAAAGLLHDIGHGPLSHSLEPIFQSAFDVTHHTSGESILYGRSPFGSDIIKILSDYRIDLDEVVAMIKGEHCGPHSFLFSSPINLDTIEGICRSRVFAAKSHRTIDPRHLVAALAESSEFPVRAIDEFWNLKHEVYGLVIHNDLGHLFDGLAQSYMHHNIGSFSKADFLKTEDQLRQKQPVLFQILAWAKTSRSRAYHRVSELAPELLNFPFRAQKREFAVFHEADVVSPSDLKLRYKQKKSFHDVTLNLLVTSDLEREALGQ